MTTIDIGIFAHNEEAGIGAMLGDLARQTILRDDRFSVRVFVLANGCRDGTAAAAQGAVAAFPDPAMVAVLDLAEGGKSRTWNRFVHDFARPDADLLAFLDADIGLPQEDVLARLVAFLEAHPGVDATSSQPVKDIDYHPVPLGFVERLISAGGGSMGNLRTSICGQLYVMRGAVARGLRVPIGLPVEDGFIRHALITGRFADPIRYDRIDQPDGVIHLYESERKLGSLIRHQIRIVVGGAINAAVFGYIIPLRAREGEAALAGQLDQAARDPQWLPALLRRELPRGRFGWVPWPFLTDRTTFFLRNGPHTPRKALMAFLGLGFDSIAFVAAQLRLARGKGAGFW
ncbi:glycosyltransferase [Sphingomonas fuzhouensis]|uniref:glycosyltransferase n=1 Tax=Sphingomonas fuzhouensis TaxID=3106033 RepID=UPI002AFFF47D|nr:glycosyltransferase [Sphingomonas sp. SGZ-02]